MKNKNEKVNMLLAQRLKLARKGLGYRSARAFALQHGIPIQTYLNHESGKRGLSIPVALHYCSLMNLSFNWLITGEGDMWLPETIYDEKTS